MPAHIVFQKPRVRPRYFPPFQPWGLLHGVVVTISGVFFWVGVWDILDYAVLPRGWQWRLVAVFFGVAGMYATGTLWRDDDFAAGAEGGWEGEGEADEEEEGDVDVDEEAAMLGVDDGDGADRARRAAARAWAHEAHGGGSDADASSDAGDDGGGARTLLPAPATPLPSRRSGDGGGDIAMTPLTGLRAVAAAPPPPGPPHAYGAPVVRLPRAAFFQRPPFERLMFTKFLLSHLAAVAAWTGLWDILDQTVLPAISESCILRAGFLAEYPCVLVKFALVAVGTAGLHWTGTLYTIEEDMGARPGFVSGHMRRTARGVSPHGLPLPWQAQLARPPGAEQRRRRRTQPAPLLAAAAVIARLKRRRAARVAARAAAARARRGNSGLMME